MTWYKVTTVSGFDTAVYTSKQDAIHAYCTVLKGQYGDGWRAAYCTQQPRLLIAMSRRACILGSAEFTSDKKIISCARLELKHEV